MYCSNVGQDLLMYQKEVQNYVEMLKWILLFVFFYFVQMLYELVVVFYKRVNQLFVELGGCDELLIGDMIFLIVI